MVRKAKGKYVKETLAKYKNNPRKFWEVMNSFFKAPKTHPPPALIDKSTGELVSNNAEYINDFFSEIGEKLFSAKNIAVRPYEDPAEDYLDVQLDDTHVSFNLDDIRTLSKQIDITKPSGVPHVSSTVMKDTMLSCTDIFHHLFEYSIMSGTFPSDWNNATITPLPKSGNLKEVSNWRPISILPIPSKIYRITS